MKFLKHLNIFWIAVIGAPLGACYSVSKYGDSKYKEAFENVENGSVEYWDLIRQKKEFDKAKDRTWMGCLGLLVAYAVAVCFILCMFGLAFATCVGAALR